MVTDAVGSGTGPAADCEVAGSGSPLPPPPQAATTLSMVPATSRGNSFVLVRFLIEPPFQKGGIAGVNPPKSIALHLDWTLLHAGAAVKG